jgi:hypothetical protein
MSPACGEIGVGNFGYTDERHNKIIDSGEYAEDSI